MTNHANRRQKIGIFSGFYLPHLGGVERYVDKLSLALMRLGYEVVIVTSNHDNLPEVEELDGRTVYRLPVRSFAKNRYPIPAVNADYRRLIRRIENENIDVFLLNTRFNLTSLVGAKMANRLGRPALLVEHGTGHFTVNNRLLDYFGKLYEHGLTWRIKKYVSRYYGVSEACNAWLKHFSIRAKGVFYNAIDTADKKRAGDYYRKKYDPETIVVAFGGRLIKEKGILNLLEAFTQVRGKHPDLRIKLVVAGDGPLFDSIKRDYSDPSIELLGKIDFAHMLALFKRTDIFAHPSLYPEGLPTSILEAGLLDCAVVATPRGGTAEVITSGQHGIITDGSVGELTEAIARLASDEKLRKKLAKALQQRVEDVFNWDAVARSVDNEIKSLKQGRK